MTPAHTEIQWDKSVAQSTIFYVIIRVVGSHSGAWYILSYCFSTFQILSVSKKDLFIVQFCWAKMLTGTVSEICCRWQYYSSFGEIPVHPLYSSVLIPMTFDQWHFEYVIVNNFDHYNHQALLPCQTGGDVYWHCTSWDIFSLFIWFVQSICKPISRQLGHYNRGLVCSQSHPTCRLTYHQSQSLTELCSDYTSDFAAKWLVKQ